MHQLLRTWPSDDYHLAHPITLALRGDRNEREQTEQVLCYLLRDGELSAASLQAFLPIAVKQGWVRVLCELLRYPLRSASLVELLNCGIRIGHLPLVRDSLDLLDRSFSSSSSSESSSSEASKKDRLGEEGLLVEKGDA